MTVLEREDGGTTLNGAPLSPLQPDLAATLNASSRLSHAPAEQRIRVVYADSSVVVVAKPSNLRSVPGFADRPHSGGASVGPSPSPIEDSPPEGDGEPEPDRALPQPPRMTPLDAWVAAIESFRDEPDNGVEDPAALSLLRRMASQPPSHLPSIPRKPATFRRYLRKSARRLRLPLPTSSAGDDPTFPGIATAAFARLQSRQHEFRDLPPATAPEQSALGQVSLLLESAETTVGGSSSARGHLKGVHAVHRLDCETSGLLVVARTPEAAGELSRAWREGQVDKAYVALVHDWPPLREASDPTPDDVPAPGGVGRSGRIDLPLRASTEERLKWVVDPDSGKTSTTLWTALRSDSGEERMAPAATPLRLELVPVTGRTHQLRVHCAAVGGGIVGDTLYGTSARANPRSNPSSSTLKLHAYKLRFPHPSDGRHMEFTLPPPW